jgi:hypothetical protein
MGEDMSSEMKIDRAAKMHLDNQDELLENKDESITPTITQTNVIKEEKTTIVQPIIIQTDENGVLKNIQYINPTPTPMIKNDDTTVIPIETQKEENELDKEVE